LFTILVVSVPFRVLAYVITPAVLAAGGARLDMLNSFITLVFLAVALAIFLPFGLSGVAFAWSLTSLCLFGVMLVRGGKLLELPIMAVISALTPALLGSLVMCIAIYAVDLQFPAASAWVSLYKIPLGGLIYVLFSWCFFRGRSEELVRVLFRLMGRA
jgi:O-antigen/teichoic acid export membrane protein